ncbi:MAG: 7-cyano-7-deazaguanine synthase QueC [Proteiniphilum sp.]
MQDYLNEDALVLFSGGQDSTTCLYWAKQHFRNTAALCFAYGQRHSQEIENARRVAAIAGASFQLVDANVIARLSPNSLTDLDITMDEEHPAGSHPNTFVPGRNLLFLTFAAAIAYGKGIRHLVTGVSEADYSGYPDCRDTFIHSANATLNLAMDKQFVIHTPLMWRNKKEVWQLADELGVFDTVRNETLTCYNGILAEGCGHCPACKLRNRGLEEYLSEKRYNR